MNKKTKDGQGIRRSKTGRRQADRLAGGPYPGPGHAGRRSIGWTLANTGAPR